MLVFSALCNC